MHPRTLIHITSNYSGHVKTRHPTLPNSTRHKPDPQSLSQRQVHLIHHLIRLLNTLPARAHLPSQPCTSSDTHTPRHLTAAPRHASRLYHTPTWILQATHLPRDGGKVVTKMRPFFSGVISYLSLYRGSDMLITTLNGHVDEQFCS